jgi:ABC-2 type transport system ATP-binding protein
MNESAISLRGVTKHYRGGGGVDDLNLEIAPGEVFGLLGPNGAGKTTAIRLILDLIRPSAGRISIFGLDSRTSSVAIRRRLGYLPGELALYDHLTPQEFLGHFAHLRGGPSPSDIAALADSFDLDLNRTIKTMSKGNRQKIGLVSALMGDPDLLLLDEPTSGLDPLVQRQVHREVRRAAGEGRTVLLSSHILSEVGVMADRVGLIRDGRLVAIERVADLQARSTHLVDVTFSDPPDVSALKALPGVMTCSTSGPQFHLEVSGSLNPLIGELAKHVLMDLSIREPGLDELFLSFYEGSHD